MFSCDSVQLYICLLISDVNPIEEDSCSDQLLVLWVWCQVGTMNYPPYKVQGKYSHYIQILNKLKKRICYWTCCEP